MRLRPTALGSTLRDTARPSRGGWLSAHQCRLSSGWLVRRPPSNTREYSTRVRTRAVRGKRASMTIMERSWPAMGAGCACNSGGETLAALGAATGQDLAAVGGRHAGTEAVVALALEVAGLEGALGGHGAARAVRRRKRLSILARSSTSGQPESPSPHFRTTGESTGSQHVVGGLSRCPCAWAYASSVGCV